MRESPHEVDPAGLPPEGVVIGFDLGGTKVRGVLADLGGRLLAEQEEPTAHAYDGAALDQIARLSAQLLQAAALPVSALRRVAVAVPGAVSPASGTVSLSPNLRLPADQPLAPELVRRLAGLGSTAPVAIDNDVNVAALGEHWQGHGRTTASMAFLSLGTGVGLGLILNGTMVRGARGAAGEIGYLPFGPDPFAAAETSRAGMFEDAVGAVAVEQLYGETISVREIFARADQNDPRALQAIETLAARTACGIAAIAALFDPAVIVLGGGIGSHPRLVEAAGRHSLRLMPAAPRLTGSALGARAGVIGALALALQDLGPLPPVAHSSLQGQAA